MFHLKDTSRREFHYHYHDFHKILILLGGDVTYCIEGRTYQLAPGDIVLVNAGEVHKPEIHSDLPYERIILYVSPDFLTEYAGEDCDLSFCFKQAYREQAHILRLQDSKGGRLGRLHPRAGRLPKRRRLCCGAASPAFISGIYDSAQPRRPAPPH